MNAKQKFDERLIDGARRYADANKSDPFALSRAFAHIRVGICHVAADGRLAGYDAEEAMEERHLDPPMAFSDGSTSWQVKTYRNVKRP